MSDHFKTLREPLIEQQKKTDEKQDKVIEQLKENQLALTSEIQGLLPQKTVEGKKDLIANIENRFDMEDRQILDKLRLIQPTELFESDLSDLTKYREDVKKRKKRLRIQ